MPNHYQTVTSDPFIHPLFSHSTIFGGDETLSTEFHAFDNVPPGLLHRDAHHTEYPACDSSQRPDH
jgi:hypothetical protein